MSEEIKNNSEEVVAKAETASESSSNTERNTERSTENRSSNDRERRDTRGEGGGYRPQRTPRFKKKVCRFCHDKNAKIDYKRPEILEKFITDRGKILPRRITGTCAKHQRWVATAIKKSRMIALLPFVEQ